MSKGIKLSRLRLADAARCVEAGTYPSAQGDDGWTPLHDAAMYDENLAVIRVLQCQRDGMTNAL